MADDQAGSLTYVLDHNFGSNVLRVLQESGVRPNGRITSLAELGFPGDTPDEDWISDLGKRGGHVAISRDGDILNVAVQRKAWQAEKLSMLLLDKKWGLLPLREIVRSLLYWWPHMTRYSAASKPGTAWTVSHKVPEPDVKGIRLVTGPDADRF